MARIHERIEHESGAELTVSERHPTEAREPWKCITLRMDDFEELTPKELRALGKWLTQQGRRIGRTYKSNGAPKPFAKKIQVTN